MDFESLSPHCDCLDQYRQTVPSEPHFYAEVQDTQCDGWKRLVDLVEAAEPDAIDATTWRAEHALRPAVVTRKVCGNRSERGAQTHAALASVLRTIQQRQLDANNVFSDLLRSPEPITALAPPRRTNSPR